MISEHAAFAKVRARIRREIVEAEESEHEGGELNLVPYLDIVTNVVMFLLATTASVLALGNINVSAPRYEPPSAGMSSPQPEIPEEKLNLTVIVSYKGFIIGGAGGVMKHSDGTLPTIKCKVELRNNRCPVFVATKMNERNEKEAMWVDNYDYEGLTKLLKEVKLKYINERQAIMSADRNVPYQVIVKVMDTLRGHSTLKCTGQDGCLFDQVLLSAGVQ
ncbi:MAG: biopolymer transporter ExbD [Pseudomonadota bacterium]